MFPLEGPERGPLEQVGVLGAANIVKDFKLEWFIPDDSYVNQCSARWPRLDTTAWQQHYTERVTYTEFGVFWYTLPLDM